jgi:ketosteroid isomerase-like protein
MTQSASQKVISEFIERCDARMSGRGGADPCELLASNVVVTVNGTTPVSGRFPGLEIVKGILVDTVAERMLAINVSVEEFVGQGERVATLLKITGRTKQGRTYNEKGEVCGCVFEVKGGRVTEVFLFPDTTLIEMVLFNRKYVPNKRPAAA